MSKKFMGWKTRGMNRDLSVTAFNPEFAFENRNLRLSTNEANTLLSWVNERGTAKMELVSMDSRGEYHTAQLSGIPIGTAVINHQLIVFTTNYDVSQNKQADYIYKLHYKDNTKTSMVVEILFGENGDSLNFDVEHPLETLVNYESESIQKIYWTDGKNQPRVINIAKKTAQNDASQFDFVPELSLNEEIKVEKMLGANGMFAPGVIQYAFTYYRKNGQESNIFYTTPLHYISYRDRGASPEDKVENAFRITITNPDAHFDYLRIYSIQRTSIDSTPIVKRIQDLSLADAQSKTIQSDYFALSINKPTWSLNGSISSPEDMSYSEFKNPFGDGSIRCFGTDQFDYIIADGTHVEFKEAQAQGCMWITENPITHDDITGYWIFATDGISSDTLIPIEVTGEKDVIQLSYIDTGTSGDSIDPTELLYKGGETIVAETMEQKDGTLFLGNISIKRDQLKSYTDTVKAVTDITQSSRKFKPELISEGNYQYANQLTSYKVTSAGQTKESVPCGGFKTLDTYRLGVQFQHKSGKWSEPLWIGDETIYNRPHYDKINNIITVPTLKADIGKGRKGQDFLNNLKKANYTKLRPVVVFPKIQDRRVICQGIVNPTLFTSEHRNTQKDIYAQASWFFRASNGGKVDLNTGAVSPFSYNSSGDRTLPYTWKGISADTGGSFDPDRYSVSPSIAPISIRQVEIQGDYDVKNKFQIDNEFVTFNSPDIEFDEQLSLMDFSNTQFKQVGCSVFKSTLSDIDIQTVTPTCSNNGSGFVHNSFSMKDNGDPTTDSKGNHGIVSGLFYDDFVVEDWGEYAGEKNVIRSMVEQSSSAKWMVYLWNKTGALNNDIIRPANKGNMTSELKKKVISNLRYSETKFYDRPDGGQEDFIQTKEFILKPQLYSTDQTGILKFGDNVYKGNVDALLIPDNSDGQYFAHANSSITRAANTPFNSTHNWWKTFAVLNTNNRIKWPGLYRKSLTGDKSWRVPDDGESYTVGNQYNDIVLKKEGVRMKYKSTPHLAFKTSSILWKKYNTSVLDDTHNCILPILEVIQEPTLPFGGSSNDALKENVWIPCGEPVRLDHTTSVVTTWEDEEGNPFPVVEEHVIFDYSYGDTYYQRWDCLKTYPFTREDPNQLVEIGSFMLETRTNIDGRYDRNRGQINNLNMSPQNFNLFNPVYSQINNFFSYKIMDEDFYKDSKYPSQVTWSKTKSSEADVDLWTNVTLASILELDGDKGPISKIIRFNDQLLAFQDSGVSQILYNERAQLSTEQGVPIELGNSGKVTGKSYISNVVGCSNKWSIVQTPSGIYFMDSNEKSIYLFNGQMQNLSTQGGVNTFCKKFITSSAVSWNPNFPVADPQHENHSAFVAYYDRLNQDVQFINNSISLAYSEKLNAFTSFYDYGGASFFCNLDDTGIWIKDNTLWKHQSGDYCRFFGVNKSYSTILIANQEPQISKIFTNMEFRACVDYDMWLDEATGKYYPYLPFDSLEVWDEYQHGIGYLKNNKNMKPSSHHTLDNEASLIRKFRIWRTDVPRDNAGDEDVFDETFDQSFFPTARIKKHPMDRMRNPWLYIKLKKEAEQDDLTDPDNPKYRSLNRTEVHDVIVTYFD